MDFDSYSERLADLNEFSKFLKKPKKIEQKRFQIINDSMQMKSVSKIQFGQLNDKRFYFSNGLISLPYGHPYLQDFCLNLATWLKKFFLVILLKQNGLVELTLIKKERPKSNLILVTKQKFL